MLRTIATLFVTALAPVLHGQEDGLVTEFQIKSERLTAFWGRDVTMEATVVLPIEYDPAARTPICFNIHGFGGSHRGGRVHGLSLLNGMEQGYPRLVYVFLNGNCPLGHHVFADSVNNGPWGTALVEEFIPQLEEKFGCGGDPGRRFLTGHSSGGWSSLWLQITYPEFFGGTWSTSPDSVTFRDFSGIDLYTEENMYFDAEGVERPIVRKQGRVLATLKAFATNEAKRQPYGGQIASFDAVFSPRADDGRPMEVFDRETGAIDRAIAKSWERYDMALILRNNWDQLGPHLNGKIHVYMGLEDTFYLQGACVLLKNDLEKLGSDAEIILVPERDHGSIYASHPELWPDGMMTRIHREMWGVAQDN